MTSSNVTAAKPKIGGAIYYAPVGTTLPTDATTSLAAAFTELGYASEDGLTNSNSPESDAIKAWGGDTVLTLMTSREDTFSVTLIEALKADVLKLVYGETNVSGALDTGISVAVNAKDLEEHAFVVDMIMKDNSVKRIVIPQAKITELGEVAYTDSDAVGYEITITCMADESGNTHYEYIYGDSSAAVVTLSALTIGSATLSPSFSSAIQTYTATTTSASGAVTATATDSTNAKIVVTVNGNSLTNGGSASWSTGPNAVVITVKNGSSQKIYNVTVTKS